jgi:methylenetetrahydrofolate reductase (NADPH)
VKFISDIHAAKRAAGQPVISFEFYPPKTEEGERNLLEKTIPALMQLNPDYCSVTYGAGGSTRDKTLAIVDRIQRQHGLTGMAHLTCVGSTRDQLTEVIQQTRALGIKNILALRGDPTGGNGEFCKMEGGFNYAYELVQHLRELDGFSIGAAGFPEGHVACKGGRFTDWQHLKQKIDCGVDFVLTQLFFDNSDFFEFYEHMTSKLGTAIPICPGILPVSSASQVKKFTQLCGARLPDAFLAQLEPLAGDDAAAREFGIEYATRQCEELLRAGVPGLHFYTLNKAHSVTRILQNLRGQVQVCSTETSCR